MLATPLDSRDPGRFKAEVDHLGIQVLWRFYDRGTLREHGTASNLDVVAVLFDEFCRGRLSLDWRPARTIRS